MIIVFICTLFNSLIKISCTILVCNNYISSPSPISQYYRGNYGLLFPYVCEINIEIPLLCLLVLSILITIVDAEFVHFLLHCLKLCWLKKTYPKPMCLTTFGTSPLDGGQCMESLHTICLSTNHQGPIRKCNIINFSADLTRHVSL